MVVSAWGGNVGKESVQSIPLWFNIPDCYWTSEGLSRIASVIGEPLCADSLTSKLELLPIAKMCVKYQLRNPLANVIKVVDLYPIACEKSVVEVSIFYPSHHKVAACPMARRISVVKEMQILRVIVC